MLKKSLPIVSFFLSVPLVYALDSEADIFFFFKIAGEFLKKVFSDQYATLFVLAITLFMLFFSILNTVIQKVSMFEGKSGKMVAVSMSLLSELALFYSIRARGLDSFLFRILGTQNLLTGLIIFIVVFLGFRKMFMS